MAVPDPAFARDPATAAYYEQRAEEYDEWYLGQGRFASHDRPGWQSEVERVIELVLALDQSRAKVALTQSRLSNGVALGTTVRRARAASRGRADEVCTIRGAAISLETD
jgi:hypothetical protein